MTDNEIIKSLKCCAGSFGLGCRECSYPRTYDANCGNELMRNALDLINRQKAEIERLKEDLIFREKQLDNLVKEMAGE